MKKFGFLLLISVLASTNLFINKGKEVSRVEPYVESDSHLLIPQKNVILIVLPRSSTGNFLAVEDLELLRIISSRIEDFPAVKEVRSILNAQVVRADEEDIVVSGFLPRGFWEFEREKQERILRELTPEVPKFRELFPYTGNRTGNYSIYVELARRTSGTVWLRELKELRREIGKESGREFYYTGKILLQAQTEEYLGRDLGKLIPVLLLIISLIFLTLQSLKVLLYAWGAIFFSLAASMAVIRIFQVEITPLVLIVPVFGMGLLSDYIIHFFYHYLRRSPLENGEAVRRRLLLPLSLTAASSVIGFAALCYLGGPGHLFLGLIMCLSILTVWGFVFFGFSWITFSYREGKPQALLAWFGRMQMNVFRVLVRIRIPFYSVLVVLILMGLVQIGNTRLDTYPLGQMPRSSPIRRAEEILTEDFSGTIPFFLEIDTGRAEGILDKQGIQTLERIHEQLDDSPLIGFSHSLLMVIKTMNYFFFGALPEEFRIPETGDEEGFRAMIEQYLLYYSGTVDPVEYESLVDSSYRFFSIKGFIRYRDWNTVQEFTRVVSLMRDELPAGWNIQIHGAFRLLLDESEKLKRNWFFSYLIGTILIASVILLIYRDIKLAGLSILPALVSIILSMGIINFLKIPIDAYSIIFVAIITGLVVDYSIHTLVGLSFFSSRGDGAIDRRIFRFVTDYSGVPIFLSFLTSMTAFAALLLSSFRGAVILGLLLLSSLLVAFLISVYLLPLLVLSFDEEFLLRGG